LEVDFIIGNKLAIEIKGTDLVADKHLKGIRALKEEGLIQTYGRDQFRPGRTPDSR